MLSLARAKRPSFPHRNRSTKSNGDFGSMLSLDSPRWRELRHAYGPAVDTPALLAELRAYPRCEGEKEPWWSIWSSLAHQGDVYSASFAAVPHVVAALATNPLRCDSSYIHLPAWVEICRVKNNTLIPAEIGRASCRE